MFLISDSYYKIKSTKKKGQGAFAAKEIPAGTIIGDYLGRLVKDEEIIELEKKCDNACYSMDYNDNGLSIFPVDIKGKGIHLINHSCAPNLEAYFYYGHTLYFALRRILPGEELTIDYSFDTDGQNVKEFLHPCFCGSPLCRGTMYASEEKLRRFGSFCRQESKGQKFVTLKAGEILPPLEKYPQEIKDNLVFDLFASGTARPLHYKDKKLPGVKEIRKNIRETGRAMQFDNLGLKAVAVVNGRILIEK